MLDRLKIEKIWMESLKKKNQYCIKQNFYITQSKLHLQQNVCRIVYHIVSYFYIMYNMCGYDRINLMFLGYMYHDSRVLKNNIDRRKVTNVQNVDHTKKHFNLNGVLSLLKNQKYLRSTVPLKHTCSFVGKSCTFVHCFMNCA